MISKAHMTEENTGQTGPCPGFFVCLFFASRTLLRNKKTHIIGVNIYKLYIYIKYIYMLQETYISSVCKELLKMTMKRQMTTF